MQVRIVTVFTDAFSNKCLCLHRCNMKCFTKFTDQERNNIFHQFYNEFHTKTEQDIYVRGQIQVMSVKQRRPRKEEANKACRERSFQHHVTVAGKKIKVCQTAFLNLHALSKKRLERIKKLVVQNKTPMELRGLNTKTHAISQENLEAMRAHINSYPVKIAHYTNKDMRYLNPRLNIKLMYEMFIKKYPTSPVKYSYFVKFFHENFNLKFGRPQIDTCCTCELLSLKIKSPSLNDAAKRAASAELTVHKRRAQKFYTTLKDIKKECQERTDTVGLCFDYMQNVHLPEVPVQDLFYLTQLSVNIFCIHDVGSGKSYYYIYHEGTANKGPDEVLSFIMDYINNYVDTTTTKRLRLFSDNCPGQNKNHAMVRACMALIELGKFENIQHYYPLRGHSFMPCDRDFGVIKRLLKKYDRIYSIHQYTKIIAKSSKHFTIKEVVTDDILNFKAWWPHFYKKVVTSEDVSKKKFGISEYHHFIFDKEKPGSVVVCNYINSFVKHEFKLILTKNKKRCLKLPVEKSYPDGRVPILKSKVEHMKKLIKFVDKNRDFYEDIIEKWPVKPSKNNTAHN